MNRKDTEKDTDEKDTEKDTEQPQSSSASELVPVLAPRRASKDGCRFRCILCAVGRVKADRRGPKGMYYLRSRFHNERVKGLGILVS